MEDRREYDPGSRLIVELPLICRGIDYLPYFIFAFGEMGKRGVGRRRGKFELEEVRTKTGTIVYKGGNIYRPEPIRWSDLLGDPLPERVTLRFVTPVRIKYRERLCGDLEFHILMRSLLRRISLLTFFHCGRELEVDFRGLILQAQKVRVVESNLLWHDWLRYSHRQRARLKLGGLMGEMTFEGNLEPFWPFLKLGEWIHVGKGTSFGLGRYRIL